MVGDLIFYLALVIGIIIFFKLGNRIPIINRIIIAISSVIILFLIFIFISAIITFILVFLIIIILLAFLSSNYLKFRKIRLKR